LDTAATRQVGVPWWFPTHCNLLILCLPLSANDGLVKGLSKGCNKNINEYEDSIG